jgi:hypothetical protein
MPKSSKTVVQQLPALSPLEQHRVARPPEAEQLSGLDWDTIERNYPELIIKLSKRAVGMRVGHALQLNAK